MAIKARLLAISLIAGIVSGCGEKLPEQYGVYAKVSHQFKPLDRGLTVIGSDLKYPASSSFSSADEVLIFDRDLPKLSSAEVEAIGIYRQYYTKSTVELVYPSGGGVLRQVKSAPSTDDVAWSIGSILLQREPIKGQAEMLRLRVPAGLPNGAYILKIPGNPPRYYSFGIGLSSDSENLNYIGCKVRLIKTRESVGMTGWIDFGNQFKKYKSGNFILGDSFVACNQGPLDAAKVYIGRDFVKKNDAQYVLPLLDSVLRADPVNIEAITYKGSVLEVNGDLAGALKLYNDALLIDPTFPLALKYRATVHDKLGHADLAGLDRAALQATSQR